MIEKPCEPIIKQVSTQSVNQSQTLLQKYNINIDHLDFEYIKATKNARELEKIVLILQSGQEGYYPDLMKCAENRLQVLNPASKILRTEEKVLTRDCMETDEWNDVTNEIARWENDMKENDKKLRNDSDVIQVDYPPIRKSSGSLAKTGDTKSIENTNNRIKTCDYNKWDKYDADAEITKMDLHEERNREQHNQQINLQKSKLIEELDPKAKINSELSEIEKEVHANRCRERGNEYFRTKEYNEAVSEYTKSINMKPTAAAYNNRAMTYLKLHLSQKALSDCNECLNLEPFNIKAHLRKAQALLNEDKKREAFYTYETVLSIDPENITAQSQVTQLKKQVPDLIKPNTFRMKIDEDDVPPPLTKSKPLPKENASTLIKPKPPIKCEEEPNKDIDFAKLIIPNKIVKNRLPEAMKAFGHLKKETTKKIQEKAKQIVEHENRDITILPREEKKKTCKPLIQEL